MKATNDLDGNTLMSLDYSHITALMDACSVAWHAYTDARSLRTRIVALDASTAVRAAKRKALEEFAAVHGWRVTEQEFTLQQLHVASNVRRRGDIDWRPPPIDHPEFLRLPQNAYRPVAIISHEYSAFSERLALAARFGLIATLLPVSWYWPGRINAVLYTSHRQVYR